MIINSRSDTAGNAKPPQDTSDGSLVSDTEYGNVNANVDVVLKYAAGSELIVLRDDEYSRIKHELGADDNHVLVIDRCGRLAYQIINPWSLIQFPYVKAAILSTYHDEPCGPCDIPIDEPTTDASYRQFSSTEQNQIPEEFPVLSEDIPNVNINKDNSQNEAVIDLTTSADDMENTTNSKVFILNEEGSGEQDNAWISVEVHFDAALLKSYGIQIPTDMNHDADSLDTIGRTTSEELSGPDTATAMSGNLYSTTTYDNILEQSTKENVKTTLSDAVVNIDKIEIAKSNTISSHLFLKEDLDGDRVGEIYAQSNISSWNESDYIIDNEGNEEYSTEISADYAGDPRESIAEGEASKENEITLPKSSGEAGSKQNSEISRPDMMEDNGHNQVDNSLESSWEMFRGFPRGSTATRRAHNRKSEEDHLVPIRIIFHSPHVHTSGRFIKKHEYVVLKTGHPEYHGHVRAEEQSILQEGSGLQTAFEENSLPEDSMTFVDPEGNKYTRIDQGKFRDNLGNVLDAFDSFSIHKNVDNEDDYRGPVDVDSLETKLGKNKDEIGKHYERLLPWINHILNHDN